MNINYIQIGCIGGVWRFVWGFGIFVLNWNLDYPVVCGSTTNNIIRIIVRYKKKNAEIELHCHTVSL